MIIVDLTQVLIASLMASTRGGQEPISEDLVRHIALKSLAMYRKKYKNKYGELVLADDSYNVWRKDVFPHYKANRKKTRDKDTKDWNQIFDCITLIRDELKSIKVVKKSFFKYFLSILEFFSMLLESPIRSASAILSKLLFANLRYFSFLFIRKFLGIFFIDVKVYITIEMVDKTTTKMNVRPKRLVSKK